ncbi:diguanylate cyclase [Evansella sp. AB-P1]|uniref:diguanylate cyclase n=1 Tax=Evansella sp. AB-P1 TaxID=3037653 RepID=UPI00241D4890|nr:diguanylate cyclase [Evansella sp. AB-P1]MDG5789758.1 diguanylate cyclase [Evansella sp. AB-P1]
MRKGNDKGNSKNYDDNSIQYEAVKQGRNVLAYLLLETKRCYKEGLFSDAKQNMEKAYMMYEKYVDREPPVCVQLMFGKVLEKNGDLKQALNHFNEQYTKHNSIKALISLGYISITLRDLTYLKQYEKTCLERIDSPSLPLNEKLHLQVILGYFFSYMGKDTSLVQDMVHFHKENSTILHEKLKVVDYIRWIYNLHILQLLNNRPWTERAQFIYEAESLAEQYNHKAMLMNIYNLMGIGLLEENVIRAKEYMIKSKDLAITLGNKQHEMNAYTNLFMFYQYLGDTKHAIELANKAQRIGKAINSNFNEINLVKLYYLIEDYAQALELINEIKPIVRSKNLTITRVDALVFQYKIIVKQNDVKKATRLWPFIEKVCKNHKDKVDLLLIQCQYFTLLKQYDKTIPMAIKCMDEENLSVENKLEFSMVLLEAFIQSVNDEAFAKYIKYFENLVYNKGYFGYLGYVYYYKGLFYMKKESYIQARVMFLRSKSYFSKVNNLLKQKEMENLIENIDQLTLEIPFNKQLEMMNLLTKNEIMFDSIRLVHSGKDLDDICKNITKVLHENLLFDHVYFHFKIDRERTKTLYVSDKLQCENITNDKVNVAFRKVIQGKEVCQFEVNNLHYHGVPLLSDENEVVSTILIENQSVLSEQSFYFIEQFLQFIAPKIEKVIFNELVHVDYLTKLYNRNYFIKRLNEEFQKTVDFQSNLSFIMIDIDDFRYFNNQFGHAEGDRILESVATTILQSVRSGDIVGRYGGEELIVILPNTDSGIAKVVAYRILNKIRNIHVNDMYQITASIGVSSVDKDTPMNIQELIDKADFAERYAKEHGKNQVFCFWEISS